MCGGIALPRARVRWASRGHPLYLTIQPVVVRRSVRPLRPRGLPPPGRPCAVLELCSRELWALRRLMQNGRTVEISERVSSRDSVSGLGYATARTRGTFPRNWRAPRVTSVPRRPAIEALLPACGAATSRRLPDATRD